MIFLEKKDVLLLAIESSCDETAAAVVKKGREVLSKINSAASIPIITKTADFISKIKEEEKDFTK